MCQINASPARVAYCERVALAQAGMKGVADDQAMNSLYGIVNVYAVDLWELMESYMAGTVSAEVVQLKFAEICRVAHRDAHALGQELYSGYSVPGVAADRGSVMAFTEVAYFRGFIAALQTRDPRYWDAEAFTWRYDQVARRVGMYMPKVEGSGNSGVVALAKRGETIDWLLGAADHCADCPVLADGSPYYRETLPFSPREWMTPCGGSCKCTLRVGELSAFDPLEYQIVQALGLAA